MKFPTSQSAVLRLTTGFTLLELLVAIGIIAFLMALLLPVINSVRGSARQANCISNLRQLGQAFNLYASDNDDLLPYPTESVGQKMCWFHALDPYLLRIMPAATSRNLSDVKQDPIWRSLSGSGTASTFKMNKKVVLAASAVPNISTYVIKNTDSIKLAHISQPSRTVLLFDGRARDSHPTATADHSRFDGWETYVYPRHKRRANVLFADGHVELRSEKLNVANNPASGWAANQTQLIWWGK